MDDERHQSDGARREPRSNQARGRKCVREQPRRIGRINTDANVFGSRALSARSGADGFVRRALDASAVHHRGHCDAAWPEHSARRWAESTRGRARRKSAACRCAEPACGQCIGWSEAIHRDNQRDLRRNAAGSHRRARRQRHIRSRSWMRVTSRTSAICITRARM